MTRRAKAIWPDEGGQDIAEYAILFVVILVIVLSAIGLIGEKPNGVFSNVADDVQPQADRD